MTTLLPHITIETSPQSCTATVIWMHGLGADGNDFAGLVPQLNLSGCLPIRFVFPHAPHIPITINGGYIMPGWYDLYGMDLVSRQDVAGIQKSEAAICALVEHEITSGVAPEHIVLAGFSQGCAMALHTALRLPFKIGGIVALSGYLPLAERFATERHVANAKTPIFMAHGTQDSVVIPARGEESRQLLENHGHPVQWHTYPMQHSLHPREIADISAFLQQVLAPPAAA